MDQALIEKVVSVVKTGELYDWISCNYYDLSKSELAKILQEYDYAMFSLERDDYKDLCRKVSKIMGENL